MGDFNGRLYRVIDYVVMLAPRNILQRILCGWLLSERALSTWLQLVLTRRINEKHYDEKWCHLWFIFTVNFIFVSR